MNKTIENLLNDQIKYEAAASMHYLAMASWADEKGYEGVAGFFYNQSDEERTHMTKLIKFANQRGGNVVIPALEKPRANFKKLNDLFKEFLKSEEFVTKQINHIVSECLEQKDYNIHSFMLWYVTEQSEEEALARTLLDKLNILGNDTSGHYLFDRDINTIVASHTPEN